MDFDALFESLFCGMREWQSRSDDEERGKSLASRRQHTLKIRAFQSGKENRGELTSGADKSCQCLFNSVQLDLLTTQRSAALPWPRSFRTSDQTRGMNSTYSVQSKILAARWVYFLAARSVCSRCRQCLCCLMFPVDESWHYRDYLKVAMRLAGDRARRGVLLSEPD